MGYKIKGRNTFLNEYEDINRNYSGNVTNNIKVLLLKRRKIPVKLKIMSKGPNKNFYLCYEKDVKSTESVVGEIPDKDQFWIQMFELGRSILTINGIHVK